MILNINWAPLLFIWAKEKKQGFTDWRTIACVDKKYQSDVRPMLLIGEEDYVLFLNQYGEK
ncbi:MAG: hypothetical protein ACI9YP_000710 [Colwellia sp.]|jgi:hypothetical protein